MVLLRRFRVRRDRSAAMGVEASGNVLLATVRMIADQHSGHGRDVAVRD